MARLSSGVHEGASLSEPQRIGFCLHHPPIELLRLKLSSSGLNVLQERAADPLPPVRARDHNLDDVRAGRVLPDHAFEKRRPYYFLTFDHPTLVDRVGRPALRPLQVSKRLHRQGRLALPTLVLEIEDDCVVCGRGRANLYRHQAVLLAVELLTRGLCTSAVWPRDIQSLYPPVVGWRRRSRTSQISSTVRSRK